MKLPEKKYEPKHNDKLRSYAKGWNIIISSAEYWHNKCGEEQAKKYLSNSKEYAYKSMTRVQQSKDYAYKNMIMPYYEGQYNCVIEIERLNEEPQHRLDNFFQDSLEALNKLNIQPKKSLLVIDEPSVCSEYGLYAKAIETYGDTLQKVVAIEELSELIKEICKDLRNNGNKKAIIEEIADVQIMINQLFIICGINKDEFESEYQRKLERLEKRINER